MFVRISYVIGLFIASIHRSYRLDEDILFRDDMLDAEYPSIPNIFPIPGFQINFFLSLGGNVDPSMDKSRKLVPWIMENVSQNLGELRAYTSELLDILYTHPPPKISLQSSTEEKFYPLCMHRSIEKLQ